jgi:type II secretory pathway pseudopilin PulG
MVYIGLIASIVLPRVTGASRKARETNLRATLSEIRKGVESYQAETGLYPAQLADLTATVPPATGLTSVGTTVSIIPADWRGPYLRAPGGLLPKDEILGTRNWKYGTTPPNVGDVHSLAPGGTVDGQAYSTF